MNERPVGGFGLPEIRLERLNATLGEMSFRQNPGVDGGIGKSKGFVVKAVHVGNSNFEFRTRCICLANTP
jgi:hypothetical protein